MRFIGARQIRRKCGGELGIFLGNACKVLNCIENPVNCEYSSILPILAKKWKNNVQLIKEKLQKSLMFGLIVLLCIGAMAVILFGVKQFKIGSQLSSVNQVANLSHTLVRQQANLFSVLLTNNAKSDQLVENLDNLVKENFVLDATIMIITEGISTKYQYG